MNCPSCNAEIVANSLFCPQCGERLQSDTQPKDAAGAGTPSADPESAAGTNASSPSDRSPDGRAAGLKGAMRKRRAAGDDVEEELWAGRYSAKDMVGVWTLTALLTIGLIVAGFYFQNAILWWAILATAVVAWGYPLFLLLYRRLSVRYRLTSQRFFHEQGILRHVTDRIEVIDMDDITFEQSILQRMVNVGRIRITSSDRSHPELILNGIEDVRNVATTMDDARRAERLRRGLHIEAV